YWTERRRPWQALTRRCHRAALGQSLSASVHSRGEESADTGFRPTTHLPRGADGRAVVWTREYRRLVSMWDGLCANWHVQRGLLRMPLPDSPIPLAYGREAFHAAQTAPCLGHLE